MAYNIYPSLPSSLLLAPYLYTDEIANPKEVCSSYTILVYKQ